MVSTRVINRVLTKVENQNDCIISLYSTGSHGYAQIGWVINLERFMALAHRVVWEHYYGPIPTKMTVDHLCFNRRCVNINHLRLLSNVENARNNAQFRRTHCPHGHPYDDQNTMYDGKGHRRCITCAKIYSKNRSHKTVLIS
jgi:hypothetical protein